MADDDHTPDQGDFDAKIEALYDKVGTARPRRRNELVLVIARDLQLLVQALYEHVLDLALASPDDPELHELARRAQRLTSGPRVDDDQVPHRDVVVIIN